MKQKIAFFIFILFGLINPAASKPSLAILNFENLSGSGELDYLEKAIPQLLITEMLGSKQIIIIERAKLKQIIEEHQLQLSGVVDEKTALKAGKIIGADYLLFGTILQSNNLLRLDGRISQTETGKIIIAEKVTNEGKEDIIDLTGKLARKILHALVNENLPTPAPPPEPPTTLTANQEVISVYSALNNPYQLPGSQDPTYWLFQLNAGKVRQKQTRIPLNISLVLDKSGSMSRENKLENAKKAALFVVEHLKPSDYFSLVLYDTKVYTPILTTQVKHKNLLKEIIEKIEPGSSTNLSGGLLEGYAQIAHHFKKGMVNRVLLLSDGLANTGITNPQQLAQIASVKNSKGFTLSTFGIGSDFNEDLMTNLAEGGGGNYYFINNPDDIASIFSQELHGLLSIVAQNVNLKIRLNKSVELLNTFGYPGHLMDNHILVKLNDIFSEEEKVILLKLRIPTRSTGKIALGKICLEYDDVVLKFQRIEHHFSQSLTITEKKEDVRSSQSELVMENVALFESAQMLDEAIIKIDERKFEDAEKSILKNIRFLEKHVTDRSSKRLKKQLLNVLHYEAETEKAKDFSHQELKEHQKSAKFKNYLQKKKR